MGGTDLRGKLALREALEAMKAVVTRELVIDSIITQGRDGAISGVIGTEQGGSVAFCDVCQFVSAGGNLIESMKSYAVEIRTED